MKTYGIMDLFFIFISEAVYIYIYVCVCVCVCARGRDASVGIRMGYGLDDQGSIPGRDKRLFTTSQRTE
jgi:hypothetical protein